ncbi:fatty acid desaturase [Synechococcus sp. RSCCF101]|uniref:fatty acid desaturase n=1 Tax=Synechococcus sp. RSCCF101 TaxID=2511069 RepID=UPI001248FFE8|nr:fatty acid desaturase [Synechococcus sp. RSCCF101]QEY32676.1 fatty acid desaturase [Synechococcus sp. RSCCF101]
MVRSDRRAWFQIITTLVPYALLWWLTLRAAALAIWFVVPPLVVLLSLFSLRCFSLMHDCGHDSLFRSRRLNRLFGFVLGLINAMPQMAWSRDHAFHHTTNGDWQRYRGVADFLSVDEYRALSPMQQRFYALLRHPLMAFPGGFFYLAIKPRLDLLLGPFLPPHQRAWANRAEWVDMVLNNLCIAGILWALARWQDPGPVLTIGACVLALSATAFINIFFVQHIFEASYASTTAHWSAIDGVLHGTSFLQLPPLLNWFTADIGYHNVHHLSCRIPNYQLRACHQRNAHLLSGVPTLTLSTMLGCSRFLLWDPKQRTLVTIPTVGS